MDLIPVELVVPDEVDPDEDLIRRFRPDQFDEVHNRVSAAAFYGRPPSRISVDRQRFTTLDQVLRGHDGFGACIVLAADAEQATGNRPVAEKLPENQAHAVIVLTRDEDLADCAMTLAEIGSLRLARMPDPVRFQEWKRERNRRSKLEKKGR